jgi:hypothetical protein
LYTSQRPPTGIQMSSKRSTGQLVKPEAVKHV